MNTTAVTLQNRLSVLIEGLGYEFVGCELSQQGVGRALLRIFIDKDQGVTLDDCTRVSRQVGAMLDVEDPIHGRYTLEVSSPGLNRRLFNLAQYQKQVGRRVKIRLSNPLGDKRNFAGLLQRVQGEEICLLVNDEEVTIPFSSIDKANVIADID